MVGACAAAAERPRRAAPQPIRAASRWGDRPAFVDSPDRLSLTSARDVGGSLDPLDSRDAAHSRILEILDRSSLRGDPFLQAIDELGARHAIEPHRSCLRVLAGIDLTEGEARAILAGADRHRDRLQAGLGRDPGLAVALADHLLSRAAPFPEAAAPPPAGGSAPGPEGADALFADAVERELNRAGRFHRPLALAQIAPDRDDATTWIARALEIAREVARDTDTLAPLKGGRFAALLPCTDEAGGLLAAERVLERLRGATSASWSAGVASRREEDRGADDLLLRAGRGLEQARAAGGGRASPFRPERRGHARRHPGPALTALLRAAGGERPIELRDVSIGGARIAARHEVPAGEEVTLTLREATALAREVAMPGRVLRARPVLAASGERLFEAALRFAAREAQVYRLAGILADLPGGESAATGRRA